MYHWELKPVRLLGNPSYYNLLAGVQFILSLDLKTGYMILSHLAQSVFILLLFIYLHNLLNTKILRNQTCHSIIIPVWYWKTHILVSGTLSCSIFWLSTHISQLGIMLPTTIFSSFSRLFCDVFDKNSQCITLNNITWLFYNFIFRCV